MLYAPSVRMSLAGVVIVQIEAIWDRSKNKASPSLTRPPLTLFHQPDIKRFQ
jgi:hypothetical protein